MCLLHSPLQRSYLKPLTDKNIGYKTFKTGFTSAVSGNAAACSTCYFTDTCFYKIIAYQII